MSRHRYTVSFPKATPGDEVTWPNSVQVFLDADTHTPAGVASLHEGVSDGPPTATLFSEAASVAFTCPRTGETLTCTTGSPSQTGGRPSAGGGGASEPLSVASLEATSSQASGAHFVNDWSLDGSAGTAITLDEDTTTIHLAAGVYTAQLLAVGTLHASSTVGFSLSPNIDLGYDGGGATPNLDASGYVMATTFAISGAADLSVVASGTWSYIGLDIFRIGTLADVN